MRFMSFNVLLVAASAFSVDATDVAERFASLFSSREEADSGAHVKGADDEPRNLKRKEVKGSTRRFIPRSNIRPHIRAQPLPVRMQANASPPPACGSYQLVSGADDCVISENFYPDYDVKFTNIEYDATQDSVQFDVAPYAEQMCEKYDDVEVFWLSAFPSDMTAGNDCGVWEDVDCGDEGYKKVGTKVVGCNGQPSVYVDAFSKVGSELRNNVQNGILPPAACSDLVAANPKWFFRNWVCHMRFEVSCEACSIPS